VQTCKEEIMTVEKLLERARRFEIETYKIPDDFRITHIAFTGMPEKHPHNGAKILLIPDPFSQNVSYYEFFVSDIKGVEELPHLVTAEGESVKMCRIWVKRGSIGILSTPFIVEDTTGKY
jgi:inorganic pyrophosphatase